MQEEKSYAEQIAEKSRRKKIISLSVTFSIIFVIALTIIILASITKDLRPTVISQPTSIYFNGKSSVQYDKDDEEYQEFLEEYEKAFKISVLSALFSGRLDGYDIAENQLSALPEDVTSGNYVTFLYKDEDLTLTRNNGRVYYSKHNSNYSIDFYEMTFKLSEEDKVENMTMYVKYKWQPTGSSEKNYYAEITLKGNTYTLNQIYKGI